MKKFDLISNLSTVSHFSWIPHNPTVCVCVWQRAMLCVSGYYLSVSHSFNTNLSVLHTHTHTRWALAVTCGLINTLYFIVSEALPIIHLSYTHALLLHVSRPRVCVCAASAILLSHTAQDKQWRIAVLRGPEGPSAPCILITVMLSSSAQRLHLHICVWYCDFHAR